MINQLLKGDLCSGPGVVIPNANCPVGPQTMTAITLAATDHLQTYPALFQVGVFLLLKRCLQYE